jgi:hypothetical protein
MPEQAAMQIIMEIGDETLERERVASKAEKIAMDKIINGTRGGLSSSSEV